MTAGTGSDLRQLHALLYPAASRAIRVHGLTWCHNVSQAALLDWPTILAALHRADLIQPGPSIGRVSFWYVAWDFRYDLKTRDAVLRSVLGPGWSLLALTRIIDDAVGGPTNFTRFHRTYSHGAGRRTNRPPAAAAGVRLAFRLFDEPTPWTPKTKARRRSVTGTIPVPWRQIPWVAPTGLQERSRNNDDRNGMDDDLEFQAAKKYIDSIIADADSAHTVAAVERQIAVLKTLREQYGTFEKFSSLLSIAFASVDSARMKVTESMANAAIARYAKSQSGKDYSEADELISSHSTDTTRRILKKSLDDARVIKK